VIERDQSTVRVVDVVPSAEDRLVTTAD